MKALINSMVFGIFLAACAGAFSAPDSFASDNAPIFNESGVVGVDQIKNDIRNGAAPYIGLGPWRVTYVGPRQPESVVVRVTPEAAFTTERDGFSRDFVVTLVNPEALIADEYGNLAEIGVYIGDNTGGGASSECEIRTSFFSTGTRQALPLQAIYESDPTKLQLSINPPNTVQFIRYEGTSVVFKRQQGDDRSVVVTLRVKSAAGGWTSYTSAPLPVCSSTPAPTPTWIPGPTHPVPGPQRPALRYRQVEVSRRYVTFTLFSKETENADLAAVFGRSTRSSACTEAKASLREFVLTDFACAEKAESKTYAKKQPVRDINEMIRSGDLDPTSQHDYLEPEAAERIPGSGSTYCSCEQTRYRGTHGYTYDCTAAGTVECRVPVVTYEFLPVN